MEKSNANLITLVQYQNPTYQQTPDVISVDSQFLLGCSGKLVIYHRGEQYLLRQTKSGKLILTK